MTALVLYWLNVHWKQSIAPALNILETGSSSWRWCTIYILYWQNFMRVLRTNISETSVSWDNRQSDSFEFILSLFCMAWRVSVSTCFHYVPFVGTTHGFRGKGGYDIADKRYEHVCYKQSSLWCNFQQQTHIQYCTSPCFNTNVIYTHSSLRTRANIYWFMEMNCALIIKLAV
jgi:hypothetical protein